MHAAVPTAAGLWDDYDPGVFYDEIVAAGGTAREVAAPLWRQLDELGLEKLVERQRAAERQVRNVGLTFGAGSDGGERTWPFDIIPRVIGAAEWRLVEDGVAQRVRALNLFIDDVYHEQRAIAEGVIPGHVVLGSPGFLPECIGANPPGSVWAHICGSDLVRDGDGTIYVLEDNLRVPSGVSYVLENRSVAKHVFPELFRAYSVEPVDPYIGRLGELLSSVSPRPADPMAVVLTPGVYNSAYYEHAFLAQQLGIELVEAGDLVVRDGEVLMRTIHGLERVDVVYRRIDELFLDPEVFRPDSVLGIPGIMGAWREGRVALVNAPGCGVADDKSIYPYVPDMVRFFLAEEPLLPNVPTYRCADEADRGYVLGNLDSLVVKPANESGGYGISIGPRAGAAELAELRQRIEEDPKGWVGQPVVALSTAPTLSGRRVVPRHVDLRPFTLYGPNGCYVTPGGLTRVALREGSLVVNSSQGGGSKDTWIVDDGSAPRKARRTARPRRTASSRTAATLDLGSPAPGQSPGNAARAEPRLPRPTGRDQ